MYTLYTLYMGLFLGGYSCANICRLVRQYALQPVLHGNKSVVVYELYSVCNSSYIVLSWVHKAIKSIFPACGYAMLASQTEVMWSAEVQQHCRPIPAWKIKKTVASVLFKSNYTIWDSWASQTDSCKWPLCCKSCRNSVNLLIFLCNAVSESMYWAGIYYLCRVFVWVCSVGGEGESPHSVFWLT